LPVRSKSLGEIQNRSKSFFENFSIFSKPPMT
jgi:hypothetical protein